LYDRRVCTGFNEKTKEAVPTNLDEYGAISRHANLLMKELNKRMNELDIDKETSKRAKDEASRYNHDGVRDLMIGNGWT
jgi:hypothetical protein